MSEKSKKIRILIFVLAVIVLAVTVFIWWNNRYTKIDEWSGRLTPWQVEWVEVSRGYGVDKISYTVPAGEYDQVVAVLGTVRESVSTRKYPEDAGDRNEHNMAFFSDGKLWLFQCRENGYVSLTFEDAETGAVYGCEGKLLYIHSEELWNYIVDTVNTKAK